MHQHDRAVAALKLVRAEQTRSNHDLEGADLESVRAAGIRNQVVVLDPQTRETRVGSEGLVWLIGDNLGNPLFMRIWSWPGFRQVMRLGYEAISYNRRVISPPRHRIVCDCEPEVTVARRMSLIVPVLLLSLVLVAPVRRRPVPSRNGEAPPLGECRHRRWFLPAAVAAVLVVLAPRR